MNVESFVVSMETVLRQQHVVFSRAALIAFVEGAFPLIEDRPDPNYWIDRFLEGVDLMSPESSTLPETARVNGD